jgi:hypothetical protein
MSKNSDDVRVAQIVIPDVDKEDFEKLANEKLSMLQKTGIYDDKSNRTFLGLQISCCGNKYIAVNNS